MYQYIKIEQKNDIAYLYLSNAKKANAINHIMWEELGKAMEEINANLQFKVCIVMGEGKHFTSGIDIAHLELVMQETLARQSSERSAFLKQRILNMQKAISAFEASRVPVIAAIHGVCIGAGVDLISACDIRLGTRKSFYSVMETKLGIVADMGTLQRLSHIVGDGVAKELALTSKVISGTRARSFGLLNDIYWTKAGMESAAFKLAQEIAALPTHAVEGTKKTINFSRNHSINEGLEFIADLNSHLLLSDKTANALAAVKARLKK